MSMEKTCAFTGNRAQKLPWGYNQDDPRFMAIKQQLESEIQKAIDNGYRHFISGMAAGVDMYCARLVLEKRMQLLDMDITLECAIPCRGQSDKWPAHLRREYDFILRNASKVTYVGNGYTAYCMMQRNMYMVDKASLIIAVHNGGAGGTQRTIDYAKKQGKQIIIMKP